MSLTINTNLSALLVQRNLNSATKNLNTSIERMTTGSKINHASDNAAGYSIADSWETKLSSLDIASSNAATGIDLLTTAEENFGILTDHLQRIRDLTEQAANGTYGTQSLKAIKLEIELRLEEISRVANNAEFNNIKLMSYDGNNSAKTGLNDSGINLQVGLYGEKDSIINLSVDLFKAANTTGLFKDMTGTNSGGKTLEAMLTQANNGSSVDPADGSDYFEAFAAACAGLKSNASGAWVIAKGAADVGANGMLGFIDKAIDNVSNRITKIGAASNRVQSANDAITVQSQNLTSSLSTLKDTDVGAESSKYIQAQILQQASATLLATANQTPSIALNLI